MIARIVLAAAFVLGGSAVSAADLRDTHVEVRLPPAKGLMPVYQPVAKPATNACLSEQARREAPAGKMALVSAQAATHAACQTEEG